MTCCIILENTAGEHLRQELTTTHNSLCFEIVFEWMLRRRQIYCAQRIPSVNKALSPALQIAELIPQQLDPAVVIVRRCSGGG
jgi:hypothetical protein